MLGGRIRVFTGACGGSISQKEKGRGGFGFDPVFVPEGSKRTFSEDTKFKGRVSHRAAAFRALGAYLAKRMKNKTSIKR